MSAICYLDHVPKRATQHSIFLSQREFPRTCLKPGQASLERQDFYSEAAAERPLRSTYLVDGQVNVSEYQQRISSNPIPADYLEAHESTARAPLTMDDSDPGPVPGKVLHRKASHWQSDYDERFAGEQGKYVRQRGAMYQSADTPTCILNSTGKSMYQTDLGEYGSIPRDKFPHTATEYPNARTDLTCGSAKGTGHVPGYQGSLPTNTHNEKCAKYEAGAECRQDPGRGVNITQIYHQNIPGYAGHVPVEACNDDGPRQVQTRSTMGRSYSQAHWSVEHAAP